MIQPNMGEEPCLMTKEREIPIWVTSQPSPPTDLRDFPGEFMDTDSQQCRFSLLGSKRHVMILSLREPAAVQFTDRASKGESTAKLEARILTEKSSPKNDLMGLLLPKLQFRITSHLRVKTFYSTHPFTKLPGQTMLSIEGPHRLHEFTLSLRVHRYPVHDWRYQGADLAHSTNQCPSGTSRPNQLSQSDTGSIKDSAHSTSWSTELTFPIDLPDGLHPSFCSALASRQYSLILRIKVIGAYVKAFLLEVPLQLVYNSVEEMPPCPCGTTGDVRFHDQSLPTGSICERHRDRPVCRW